MTGDTNAVKLDPDYDSEHADLTIITSDMVGFKYESFRLRAFSDVFSRMISSTSPQAAELALPDRDYYAGSKTFKAFLDLVSHATVPVVDATTIKSLFSTGSLLCNLAKLVRKARGNGPSHNACDKIIAFVIGAEARDKQLCAEVIDLLASSSSVWNSSNSPNRLSHGVRDSPLADPRTWPLPFFARTPHDFLLAALRPYTTQETPGVLRSDVFKNLMAERKRELSGWTHRP